MASRFGKIFTISTFGETHGEAVGVILEGCPSQLDLDLDRVQKDLDRRRPGQSKIVTQRKEPDTVEVLSGLHEGKTTGTPLAMVVKNKDQKSKAYDHLKDLYRPSHADYTYEAKYGIRDHRGGGRSSARETIGRVAAGAVARQLLEKVAGIEVLAWVSQVHEITCDLPADTVTYEQVESHPTRCPDAETADAMQQAIEQARRDGDSLGGIVSLVVRNVPVGLGAPVFDRIEADLAKGMLSLPATKGFEIGSGFAGVTMTGKEHNDPFVTNDKGVPVTVTNNSGGVQGGITNGSDIFCRVAFKPTATISSPQQTVTTSGEAVELRAKGRHDPCVLPRAVPLVESMALIVLADHWLRQKIVQL